MCAAKQDAAAAKRFLAKALGRQSHPVPRVINTDGHSAPPAIVRPKAEGALDEGCRHPPVPYLNNVWEQDHRAIKRRVNASQNFRSFWAAWRTIAGYEAIQMIRKGQACWNAAVAPVPRPTSLDSLQCCDQLVQSSGIKPRPYPDPASSGKHHLQGHLFRLGHRFKPLDDADRHQSRSTRCELQFLGASHADVAAACSAPDLGFDRTPPCPIRSLQIHRPVA
jgi:DDE domain